MPELPVKLTRHHAHRAHMAPEIYPGKYVTVESAHVCRDARIVSVTRVGARLNALLVVVEPRYGDEFVDIDMFGDGNYRTERTLVLKVRDDGLPYKTLGDASLSLEWAR